ncbi:hypothetical protein MOW08_09925 [Acinetobacter schindleri]|nr:hypothetical protein MOW08_09925 [Acinetobacter schindleri]
MSQIAIPYQLRARLSQLEPSLDLEWERELKAVLADISPELKESIDFQILKPKEFSGIRKPINTVIRLIIQ